MLLKDKYNKNITILIICLSVYLVVFQKIINKIFAFYHPLSVPLSTIKQTKFPTFIYSYKTK